MDAPVILGFGANPLTLIGPTYSNPASELGGGRIGLVPFRVHATDCQPANGLTIAPSDTLVKVRYYGDVTWNTASNPLLYPLIVKHRKTDPSNPSAPYSDTLTTCFTAAPDTNTSIINLSRTVDLPVGDYVVSATPGVLKNDIPLYFSTELYDVDPASELKFTVAWPCPGDLNSDNAVNVADLVMLLAHFGLSSPCGDTRDLNGDLGVNTLDLTFFLGRFGTTCTAGRPGTPADGTNPTPSISRNIAGTTDESATTSGTTTAEAGRPGTPAPMPPVLAALGFASIEAYTAYVDGLTDEQLSAHIVQLLETIEALNLP